MRGWWRHRIEIPPPTAEQVIEPICLSPGPAWLANAFMVDGRGWHPEVEMKAVWIQSEKSRLRIKERDSCRALSARSVAKHAEWRDWPQQIKMLVVAKDLQTHYEKALDSASRRRWRMRRARQSNEVLARDHPEIFVRIEPTVWQKPWVAHARAAGRGRTALRYLAAYVEEVGLQRGQAARL
jgi:Putative transposase